jgi:hypothetical protein
MCGNKNSKNVNCPKMVTNNKNAEKNRCIELRAKNEGYLPMGVFSHAFIMSGRLML